MNITCCPICDMHGEVSPLSIKSITNIVCQYGHHFTSINDVLEISKTRETQLLQSYEHQLLKLLYKDQKIIQEKGYQYISPASFLQTLGLLIEIQKLRSLNKEKK